MKQAFKAGDIIKIIDSDSKTAFVGIILVIDWSWSELFMHENKKGLKIGLIKMFSEGEIKSATTMDVVEIVSAL